VTAAASGERRSYRAHRFFRKSFQTFTELRALQYYNVTKTQGEEDEEQASSALIERWQRERRHPCLAEEQSNNITNNNSSTNNSTKQDARWQSIVDRRASSRLGKMATTRSAKAWVPSTMFGSGLLPTPTRVTQRMERQSAWPRITPLLQTVLHQFTPVTVILSV